MSDLAALRALYDRHERREATVVGMLREETPHTVRFIHTGHGIGVVLHSEMDDDSADAVIQDEVDRFRALGQAFEWKLHDHDAPSDLETRLAAHGFAREAEETLVALPLGGDLPEVPGGVVVQPAEDGSDFDTLHDIRVEAFGRNERWHVDALRDEHRRAPEMLRVHVAWVDGEPAAAGWTRLRPDTPFATLWGGGTVPRLRRRGAYRGLVAARLREARERGYAHALVDAGAESLPILERLGFVPLARMRPMVWRPR